MDSRFNGDLDQGAIALTAHSVLGEPTLADAMAAISVDLTLSESKRRHWLTSMARIAEGIDLPPASLPARLTAIRQPIARLNAARMNIEMKTLSNHKSNTRSALLHFAKVADVPSRGARLSPSWERLTKGIDATKPRRLLSGLMRYCSAHGIEPHSVSEETVEGYFEFRARTSFLETGIARQRELIKAWNSCLGHVTGWPDRTMVAPDPRSSTHGPDWDTFPLGLRTDIEKYLASLRSTHRAASGRRRRPCKSSTIETRQRELIAFARKAIAMGISIDRFTSLPALLDPEIVRTTLEGYWGGLDKPTHYTIDLAWKLLSIARHTGMTGEAIAELDEIWHSLEDYRGGKLTDGSLKVIRAVLTTDIWSKVCHLPVLLMKEAEKLHNRSPKKAAARAALAIQILILTRAPVRVSNLLSIRLNHNLTRPGGSGEPFLLQFPFHDVKNRIDLSFPLSAKVSGLINRFIEVFRPHQEGHKGDWLFPSQDDKHRSSTEASAAIAKRLEKETGLRITAHKFRHAAAAIILREHSGDFEYVRRVLGHLNVQTTIDYYTGLEGFWAAESFGELIETRLSQMINSRLSR